jgi:hypothetical protein
MRISFGNQVIFFAESDSGTTCQSTQFCGIAPRLPGTARRTDRLIMPTQAYSVRERANHGLCSKGVTVLSQTSSGEAILTKIHVMSGKYRGACVFGQTAEDCLPTHPGFSHLS